MGDEKQPPLSPLAQAQAELAEANRRLLTDEQLTEALQTFEQIMTYRNDMYLRLARRVRSAVRGGMVVFALVGIAMFLLLITLVTQVEHARNSTALLAQHVNRVGEDMQMVEATMTEMDRRMRLFGSIGEYMHVMTDHTSIIAGEMADLDMKMKYIRNQLSSINGRLLHVTRGMGSMGHAVNGMGYSINEFSGPAGMFGVLP